ncbi:phage tail tube protein [Rhodococcus pyridinivorans]|uniref:phage tail tube protein n=1 Tax=Rhodococcus pyridinivorans TaxID=103816 RepID=UPI003D7FB76F
MSAPLTPPASTELVPGLTRNWAVQVNVGTIETPDWEFVIGITSFDAPVSKALQDAGDINFGVWGGQLATEANWTVNMNILMKLDAAGEPNPATEFLRQCSTKVGVDGMAQIRYWRTDGFPDSYMGRGDVQFSGGGGDKTSLHSSTVTITGYGPLEAITKPTATTP